jgi:predicted  nucleic acid-binding Zn-ribbon protein
MKEQLAALLALQQQDNLLNELKRQFALLDSGAAEKADLDAVESDAKSAQEAMSGVSADLKDAELEQQQIDEKRKEYELKLYGGKVHNPKELQAMQDEVEMLQRQRVRLDDKIIGLMDAIELRKGEQAGAKERLSAAKSKFKAKVAAYRVAADAIRNQAQEIVNSRPVYSQPIQAQLLKRYEAMRLTKAGIAIVAIQDQNACGGCKMALPSSLVTRIREGSALEYCQNCGRMLCEGEPKVKAAAK